jgi:hypothetical protein
VFIRNFVNCYQVQTFEGRMSIERDGHVNLLFCLKKEDVS